MRKATKFSVGDTIYFLSGTKTIASGTISLFIYPHHFRTNEYSEIFDLNLAGGSPEEALENYKRVKLEHFENRLATTQRTIDRIKGLDFSDYKVKNFASAE